MKLSIPCNPAILLPRVLQRISSIFPPQHMTQMFLAIRVRLVKTWKQPKRPSTRKWIHYGIFPQQNSVHHWKCINYSCKQLNKSKTSKKKKTQILEEYKEYNFFFKAKNVIHFTKLFFKKQRERAKICVSSYREWGWQVVERRRSISVDSS